LLGKSGVGFRKVYKKGILVNVMDNGRDQEREEIASWLNEYAAARVEVAVLHYEMDTTQRGLIMGSLKKRLELCDLMPEGLKQELDVGIDILKDKYREYEMKLINELGQF
jgi:hypothetical protein